MLAVILLHNATDAAITYEGVSVPAQRSHARRSGMLPGEASLVVTLNDSYRGPGYWNGGVLHLTSFTGTTAQVAGAALGSLPTGLSIADVTVVR